MNPCNTEYLSWGFYYILQHAATGKAGRVDGLRVVDGKASEFGRAGERVNRESERIRRRQWYLFRPTGWEAAEADGSGFWEHLSGGQRETDIEIDTGLWNVVRALSWGRRRYQYRLKGLKNMIHADGLAYFALPSTKERRGVTQRHTTGLS